VNDSNGLIPVGSVLLGGLLTYFAMIHREHITTAREREAKLNEQQAERLRAHNRFQAKTLMAIQKLAMRYVERNVDLMALSVRIEQPVHGYDEDFPALKAQERTLRTESRNIEVELALRRERIVDDELRSKLRALNETIRNYRARFVPDEEIRTVIKDLDSRFQGINDCVGELLRNLI
jgi:hypothetical protein